MPLLPNTKNPYKRPWYDSLWFGTVLGLVCPWVIFYLYYLVLYGRMGLHGFYRYLIDFGIFISTMSLCVFASNLLVFFIFIWTKKDKSSKGVLLSTILYAFFVAITKLM